MLTACMSKKPLEVTVYETSVNGNKLTKVSEFEISENPSKIQLNPEITFQTITGFGGPGAHTASTDDVIDPVPWTLLTSPKRDFGDGGGSSDRGAPAHRTERCPP